MCGIAGYASIGRGYAPPPRHLLQDMAHCLRHRGPDGISVHIDGHTGLAFSRLSIVDQEGGGQPILSHDGSVAVIANGEVYNHRELAASLPSGVLRSASDCEVLVHLYQRDGIHFLDRVRGIYAIAIWDRRQNRVILARDRFGIKPLYFHKTAERLIFASEIKALLLEPGCPRRLDWRACLTDQTSTSAPVFEDSEPVTYVEGIEAVPAATVLEIDVRTGQTQRHAYWQLPSFAGEPEAGRTELVRGYGEALASAVAESCMSDAEIGLMLSGGIDSAAVAALAQVPAPLQTFTALNGGTLANGDGEHAHRVASALGLPNHQVALSVRQVPSPRQWRALLWQVESPLCGPEQFYKFELHRFARSTRPDLKVMLLGQASDEFNGGYTTVIGQDGWADFEERLRWMALHGALAGEPGLAPWWDHEYPLLRAEVVRELGGGRGSTLLGADPYQLYVRWKYRDIQQYNCWHEDRTAAGNGIEARVPFLDHRVVEAAAAVPPALRPDLLWDKQILREALTGVLPPEVLKTPKAPFFYGPGEYHVNRTFVSMLAQDGGLLVEEALSGDEARHYLDADGIRSAVAAMRAAPGRGHVAFVLRAVNFGLLAQLVAGTRPAQPDAPTPLTTGSAGEEQRGTEIPVKDWDAERARLEARILDTPQLPDTAVPAWADGVLLAAPVTGEEICFIVVDGSIEYVLSADEDPEWAEVARLIDGNRTVAELTAFAASTGTIRERIAEAASAGLLDIAGADGDLL